MEKTSIYSTIVFIATSLQLSLPMLKLDEATSGIATAILLSIATVFTLLRQRASIEIDKKAQYLTWVLVSIAVLGGVNEVFKWIPFSGETGDTLRNVIAFLINLLNIVSKQLFPTEEGKELKKLEATLKK